MKKIFTPADILLPVNCDMNKWSVVACDQFSSQPEYWAALETAIGDAPSTLHLMLPEAYLETRDQFAEAERINACMRRYLADGIFRELPASYLYVERTLPSGAVRRGLVGALDLEAYDYSSDSVSPIRATEGTVEERLPPRVRIRREAPLEMPHIMVFIDDAEQTVLQPLSAQKAALHQVYGFSLNGGGGELRGWQVSGAAAEVLEKAIDGLGDETRLREKYGDCAPAIFAMGDGNHSLATAKKCWEELKPTLSEAERETHPARYSLVELVNIHDEAITFEPIHKVLFDTDPAAFLDECAAFWSKNGGNASGRHTLKLVVGEREAELTVPGLTIGQLIGRAEEFCQGYMAAHGGRIDYIHNDDTAITMGRRPGCAALLLPRMEKGELFPSIIRSGPFPKKSFSIGHAEDKRYYLECRKIK